MAHATTIAVHWHDENQPVYSLDFQPDSSGPTRLATGGGDNNVRIWAVTDSKDSSQKVSVHYLSTLSKHTQAVNCVRFNPKGDLLATASDDGSILIWQLSDTVVREFGSENEDQESWSVKYTLCGSSSEIYDLAWSPDSKYVIAGSMDNVTRVYAVSTGQQIAQTAEHNHYVQGVAWDPLNEYLASQSADRSVHIYKIHPKDGGLAISPTLYFKSWKSELPISTCESQSATCSKSSSTSGSPTKTDGKKTNMDPPASTHRRTPSLGSAPSPGSSYQRSISPLPVSALTLPAIRVKEPSISHPSLRSMALYHNETLQSFFRRLSFSPDGSLLLTPSGLYNDETNTVYINSRPGLNRPPIAHLPGLRKPAIAIRFSQIIYKLRDYNDLSASVSDIDRLKVEVPGITEPTTPILGLPYRMVFAVATLDSVIVYDTQTAKPLVVLSNIHYTVITDISWSTDGTRLFISSADGFCTCLDLDRSILGEALTSDVASFNKDRVEAVSVSGTKAGETMKIHEAIKLTDAMKGSMGEPLKTTPNDFQKILPNNSQVEQTEHKREGKDGPDDEEGKKKKRRIQPTLLPQ